MTARPLGRPWLVALAGLGAAILTATACSTGPKVSRDEAQDAVARALPLLQHSMQHWFEERTCTSCHHHSLGVLAVSFAKERGFPVDEDNLRDIVSRLANSPDGTIAALQGRGAINPASGRGFQLAALAAAGHPADERTDAMVHLVAGLHRDDGAWLSESHRPPLEDTAVTSTALCSGALLRYGVAGRRQEFAGRLERTRAWLEGRSASSNEERSMKLLGLHWTGANDAAIAGVAADLLARQNADGGWAQIDGEGSDAYATGQSLVILQQVGGLSTGSEEYRRGARWLLDRQHRDGSWLVRTRRRFEGLEQFDSGFPHGEDQFISCAATCWAVMAIAATLDPHRSRAFERTPLARADAASNRLPALHTAAAFGSHEELLHLLDRGVDPNLAGPDGLTALMLAVHDSQKVATLLARGARVDTRSDLQNTALILAGRAGPIASLELLLGKAADPAARDDEGTSALFQAVQAGAREKIARLLASGGSANDRTNEGIALVQYPCWVGDAVVLQSLLAAGASLDVRHEGAPPLVLASMDGLEEIVSILIAAGVPVDAPDRDGLTALAWAARVRWGHGRIAAALLAAGADPDRACKSGETPRRWAQIEDNRPVLELFEAMPSPR